MFQHAGLHIRPAVDCPPHIRNHNAAKPGKMGNPVCGGIGASRPSVRKFPLALPCCKNAMPILFWILRGTIPMQAGSPGFGF